MLQNYAQLHTYPTVITFTKPIVHAEVVLATLSVHQLTQSIHKAVALFLSIISFVRQIDFHATLHALGNAVGDNSLCKKSESSELVKGKQIG